jgi:hypothetical protein
MIVCCAVFCFRMLQKQLVEEFSKSLECIQQQQEARMAQGAAGAAAQLAKERRKGVINLLKVGIKQVVV